jgi:hypothetical protein
MRLLSAPAQPGLASKAFSRPQGRSSNWTGREQYPSTASEQPWT